LGVRHAFSQAYHHEGNARAEVLGAQIQKRLRKMKTAEDLAWQEALPRALRTLHDSAGPSGLSPFQVLFGRERWYGGVPYQPPTRAEDAVAFFERMQDIDHRVAKILNEEHAKTAETVNKRRKELPELEINDKVWYLRPRTRTGEKLETYGIGPCVVA
jgi:FAD/FMN-containing dehydrogenase